MASFAGDTGAAPVNPGTRIVEPPAKSNESAKKDSMSPLTVFLIAALAVAAIYIVGKERGWFNPAPSGLQQSLLPDAPGTMPATTQPTTPTRPNTPGVEINIARQVIDHQEPDTKAPNGYHWMAGELGDTGCKEVTFKGKRATTCPNKLVRD